jgi:hypothetical protein
MPKVYDQVFGVVTGRWPAAPDGPPDGASRSCVDDQGPGSGLAGFTLKEIPERTFLTRFQQDLGPAGVKRRAGCASVPNLIGTTVNRNYDLLEIVSDRSRVWGTAVHVRNEAVRKMRQVGTDTKNEVRGMHVPTNAISSAVEARKE